MKWNLENNKKWTQKYKTEEFTNLNLEFFGTEIWSPVVLTMALNDK
ncbi:hypothetical protein [Flavobacterium sp. HSC-61S13]|nr:hypothetical protein [Flavobacterium sp. HSC-61S13]MCP1994374.1 hypothetical protein [Flavobacterium sp. HSC-61S13]